jgi:hypothetical protein
MQYGKLIGQGQTKRSRHWVGQCRLQEARQLGGMGGRQPSLTLSQVNSLRFHTDLYLRTSFLKADPLLRVGL